MKKGKQNKVCKNIFILPQFGRKSNKISFASSLPKSTSLLCSLTCVITEGVQNSDEIVQAGPMVRITPKSFLKGMASQGKPDEPQCHVSDFVPEVDVCGVQHHRLEAVQAEGTCTHMTRLLTEQSGWGQKGQSTGPAIQITQGMARHYACL